MQLEITGARLQSVYVLACSGRLVYGPEVDYFLRLADEALANTVELVVDLRRVQLLDDHGLGALTALLEKTRSRGGDVHLVCSDKRNVVNRVLRVTRVMDLFRVFSNEMDAASGFCPVYATSTAV